MSQQSPGIGLLRTVQPTDLLPEMAHRSKSLGLHVHARIFGKNVIIFVTTSDLYRHKTQHMSCTCSVRVCEQNSTSYDAAFRRR